MQMINRVLAKINILHTWAHPKQSFNYMLLLGACGTALALTPPRWIFLAVVVGKFTPGEAMTKKIKGAALTFARRYLDPPDDEPAPASTGRGREVER